MQAQASDRDTRVPGEQDRQVHDDDRGREPQVHDDDHDPDPRAHDDHGREPHPVDDSEPRRGRPRSAAAERSILDAVVELLEAGEPLAGLSIERIARTAGVGKATIYRRWAGKEELFVDVLREIEPPEPDVSGTGGLDDLRVLLESMRTRGLAQRSSVLLHNVFAQMKSHPKLWTEYQRTVIAPRRAAMLAAVGRAVAAGELRGDADVELMDDLFLGPMLVRTIHRPEAPLPEDLADRIISLLVEGLGPRAAAAGSGEGAGHG
ncbi:TetR/AcrR family transcriptional regulator [Streptomyces sp. NBC_01022]|uniref:TetR/AcrR family transcriptional regulator n=1 Tax=Streptomyces sp. NBC_01022 TaxID=2903723 RepID=UPI002DDA1D3D|nr:TetR/AcrR family transcriptional regulator [Streptomyces sp. NBC_01022]WRZ81415.1 TetR/AcrR family transcriptional regulator [Streptomyces sp. NBC_01022]